MNDETDDLRKQVADLSARVESLESEMKLVARWLQAVADANILSVEFMALSATPRITDEQAAARDEARDYIFAVRDQLKQIVESNE